MGVIFLMCSGSLQYLGNSFSSWGAVFVGEDSLPVAPSLGFYHDRLCWEVTQVFGAAGGCGVAVV